jgi:hypothetical protein
VCETVSELSPKSLLSLSQPRPRRSRPPKLFTPSRPPTDTTQGLACGRRLGQRTVRAPSTVRTLKQPITRTPLISFPLQSQKPPLSPPPSVPFSTVCLPAHLPPILYTLPSPHPPTITTAAATITTTSSSQLILLQTINRSIPSLPWLLALCLSSPATMVSTTTRTALSAWNRSASASDCQERSHILSLNVDTLCTR